MHSQSVIQSFHGPTPRSLDTSPLHRHSQPNRHQHARARTQKVTPKHKTLDRECVNTCTLTKVGHYSMLHSDMRSRHMLEVWPHLMLHYVVRMLS